MACRVTKCFNTCAQYYFVWTLYWQHICACWQGRAILKRTEDGQTAGPLFKTLYGIHAIPLAWALFLQILYNGQQFAGPLLLKKITTFLNDSVYGLAVSFITGFPTSFTGPEVYGSCCSQIHFCT